jgi:hypothetical protein
MQYARTYLLWFAAVGGFGRGQVDLVRRATAKKAREAKANKLRGAGVVCHWLDVARSGGATQSYAGLAG